MTMPLKEEEQEVEIHGDVLETILSHVPLVDLVSAARVSKWWCAATWSSLRHHNPPKPWLFLHTQATRFPYTTAVHAYDPRSNIWIKISQPSIKYISALKSSHTNFLYMLSPSNFSFSLNPLNTNWCTVNPPLVWRTDPIVARVADSVIIAGGACDFEDDPLAVEIYNLKTLTWCKCESMPGILKDSAASPWLSTATTVEKLIVADKKSGVTHWFDPETKLWSEPFVLNPGQPVSSYHIGCSDNSLILVGVSIIENVERVKVWRVWGKDSLFEEIGEMPQEFVTKLSCKNFGISSMDIRVVGNMLYAYNTWETEVVVVCELMAGGGCFWWSVRNVVGRGRTIAERLAFSCSEVGIEELRRAMITQNWRFEVSPSS